MEYLFYVLGCYVRGLTLSVCHAGIGSSFGPTPGLPRTSARGRASSRPFSALSTGCPGKREAPPNYCPIVSSLPYVYVANSALRVTV